MGKPFQSLIMEAFAFLIIATFCVAAAIETNATSDELLRRDRRAAKAKSNPQCEGLYYPLPAYCFIVTDSHNSTTATTTTTDAVPTIEITYPIAQPVAIPLGYPIPYPYFLAPPMAVMPLPRNVTQTTESPSKNQKEDHLMPPEDTHDSNERQTMKPQNIKIKVKIIEEA